MADKLIKLLREGFDCVTDTRRNNNSYRLTDMLSTGFAMFSLKDPSLASFREQYPVREENLRRIYGIEDLPSDTSLREGLDEVSSKELQSQFKAPLDVLRQEGGDCSLKCV